MNAAPLKVLVVDDEPESLALLSRILTDEGYQVRPANSSSLALAAVESATPDLVLLTVVALRRRLRA